MNRPASVRPDNLFLLLFRALRHRRVPLVLRVVCHSLLLVILALLVYSWVVTMQFKHAMQQQADALGQSLLSQTAASATELLVSNDLLSLNVLLSNLVKNPLVAHAAIYSVDNRILAESGSRPQQNLLGEEPGLYSAPITFQEVIAGHLRISLDMQQFQLPMTLSLQNMGLLSLILLAATLALSLRLGRHISTPLLQLRVWLRAPEAPAPAEGRQDEIGDLARQLQAMLVPEQLETDELDEDAETDEEPLDEAPARLPPLAANRHDDDDFDLPTIGERPRPPQARAPRQHDFDEDFDLDEELSVSGPQPSQPIPDARESAILAVHLGPLEQLRKLPREQLLELRQRHRDCLERAAELYRGELHPLNEGSSLLLFHRREIGNDYLADALCCGELLRALHQDLRSETADSGVTLQLQLSETRGENLFGLSQAKLLLSTGVQEALTLSQHSRNQLLLDHEIGDDPQVRQRARVRPVATPTGTAAGIERLLEPYAARQGRQLESLRESRPSA